MERESLTFHGFPDLPAELRDLIWKFSLPEVVPCLFPYKRGLWRFREVAPSDTEYDSENPDLNTIHEFHHESLDPVQMKIPLSAVNLEAYTVVLKWAQNRKITIHQSIVRSWTSFSSSYDPSRDILFVPVEELDNFEYEPVEFAFRSEYLDKTLDARTPWIKRIAVPVAICQSEDKMRDFAETLAQRFAALKEIVLLSDAPTSIDCTETFERVRERWELVNPTSEEKGNAADDKLLHHFQQDLQKWWMWDESIPQLKIHCQSAIKR